MVLLYLNEEEPPVEVPSLRLFIYEEMPLTPAIPVKKFEVFVKFSTVPVAKLTPMERSCEVIVAQ